MSSYTLSNRSVTQARYLYPLRFRWGRITDELFLQGEDNNRGDNVLNLGQDFRGGLDRRDDRPDGLRDIHSGDLLVLSAVELEGVGNLNICCFSAF